jgi:hypothetical protein
MDRTYANEPVASSWTLASGSSSTDVAACMGETLLVSKSVDRVGNACVLCLHGRTQAFKEGEYSTGYEEGAYIPTRYDE